MGGEEVVAKENVNFTIILSIIKYSNILKNVGMSG